MRMNFHDYLNRQKTEDRRAFIIRYPAASGKSAFALRVYETRNDVYLLDFQEYWTNHPELPLPGRFGFKDLRRFLLSLDVTESVVVVDNPDVLFNTWLDKDKRDFINWMKRQLRSPQETDKTFIFVFQNNPLLENVDLRNSFGEPRVLSLDTFESL